MHPNSAQLVLHGTSVILRLVLAIRLPRPFEKVFCSPCGCNDSLTWAKHAAETTVGQEGSFGRARSASALMCVN